MNAQAEVVYKEWDNKLNEIWKLLENKLPKEQMNKLRDKQNIWIKEKEAKKKDIEKEYGDGSIMLLKLYSGLTEMTKDRCYYLVNNYM